MDPVSLLDIINKEKEYEVEEVQNYKNIVYNFWYTEKDIKMSTISEYQKQGCYIPRKQLKTTRQGFQVKTYKRGG